MKKLIAAALALLMLLSPMALGEAGDRIAFSDMALETAGEGEAREVDLSDIAFTLTTGKPDGVPTIQAELFRKGSRTRRAVLQFIHGVAYFDMDYLTRPLALNVAAVGASAQAFVDGLFEDTASLTDFKLPPFEGVEISRVTLTPLVSLLGGQVTTGEDGTQTAAFDVPYETTRTLLEQARKLADKAPKAMGDAIEPMFKLIDAMSEGDSGFALKGTATDGKKKSRLTMDVYAVRGGVTADEAVATVEATFARNKVHITVDMRQSGYSMNLAEFTLTSKPKKARLECALNVMGMLNAEMKLYTVDGAQCASVEAKTLGKNYAATLTYGPQVGGDFIDFALSLPGGFSLNANIDAHADETGNSVGTIHADVRMSGEDAGGFQLNGDVAGGGAETEYYPVKDPGNAVSLLDMTEAQLEQLILDFKNMSGIVSRYIRRRKTN